MSIQKEKTTYDKPSIEKQIREHMKKFGEIYIKYAGLTPSTPIREIKFDILNSNTNSRIQSSLTKSGICTLKDLLERHTQTKKTNHIGKKSQTYLEDFIIRYYPFLTYSLKDKHFFGKALEDYKKSIESDLEEIYASMQNLKRLLDTISIPSRDDLHQSFIDMYGNDVDKYQIFLEEAREKIDLTNKLNDLYNSYTQLQAILDENVELSINYYRTYLNEISPELDEV